PPRRRRRPARTPTTPPQANRRGLTAGDGPYDEKGLRPRSDRRGQWGVRRLMGQILLAGEEPQHRPALLRDVVADRAAQHRIAGLERVEDRALRGLTLDLDLHLALDVRQRSQMWRQNAPDHGSVRNITENQPCRTRTH